MSLWGALPCAVLAAASCRRSSSPRASLDDFSEEDRRKRKAYLEALGREAAAEVMYLDMTGAEVELAAEFQERLNSMGGAGLLNLKTGAGVFGEALRERALKAREVGGDATKDVRTVVGTRYRGLSAQQRLIFQIVTANMAIFSFFYLLIR
jgi:hypothetical protein